MLENDIFGQWLDTEVRRVLGGKFDPEQPLTMNEKIIIVLKGQEHHLPNSDIEMRQEMIVPRDDMDRPFNRTDKYIKRINTHIEPINEHSKCLDENIERKDKHLEVITDEFNKIHQAINTQTWKMIGAIGLIVLLGKLIE
uniref:Uncharacterized protein n=1 Tax=Candidatus Kentrum sp. MB TaxID=2138164 RepID=A0A451BFT8_9GAMM|nr:MAG: hypothetical protein BECKMB1821I_GA0114274_10955 [Candidatus Kentron sp. MB]VFK77153.1 MAG: hypothetical protein BECKMB1821H_GA0114242_11045 [Candidatus Kentron sp. MB]